MTKKTNYQINKSFAPATSYCNQTFSNLVSQKRWALKPKRKITHLNQKQILQDCFYQGNKTGRNKLTAQSVVKIMRSLLVNGKKKFSAEESLTQEQVMSYFSRMKGKVKNTDMMKSDENEVLYAIMKENKVSYVYTKIYSFFNYLHSS